MNYINNETWQWCLSPHSEKEIEEKVLSDYQNICFNYICYHSPMSEGFHERLKILSIGYSVPDKENPSSSLLLPYITKDNIDETYILISDMYKWISHDFTGPYSREAIHLTGLERRLPALLPEIKRKIRLYDTRIKKTEEALSSGVSYGKDLKANREYLSSVLGKDAAMNFFGGNIETYLKTSLKGMKTSKEKLKIRERDLRAEIRDLENVLSGKDIKTDLLKRELMNLFADRVPDVRLTTEGEVTKW